MVVCSLQMEPMVVIAPSALHQWLHELAVLFPELDGTFEFHDASLFWSVGCTQAAALLAAGVADFNSLHFTSEVVTREDGSSEDRVVPACRLAWTGTPPIPSAADIKQRDGVLSWLANHADVDGFEVTAVEHCHEVRSLRSSATFVAVLMHWLCGQSFGVKITSKRGWSVVYSGDTRKSENLIKLGSVRFA